MPRVIHLRQFDPWHTVDWTGFNKVGYVTENDVVIYPRRSRIVREPLAAVRKYKHRILTLNHPRAKEVEFFFTSNLINTRMFVSALRFMGQPEAPFWDHPIKLPILSPITPSEHETKWNILLGTLQRGDAIFTFDTKSVGSRLIAYLDQGTWSHVGICSGNGCVLEAITSGVTERSIEAYHHPRYRLGIYRLSGSPAQIDKMIEFARSQVGKSYAFKKALKLGVRMILGIWPTPGERSHVSPNMAIPTVGYRLVAVI